MLKWPVFGDNFISETVLGATTFVPLGCLGHLSHMSRVDLSFPRPSDSASNREGVGAASVLECPRGLMPACPWSEPPMRGPTLIASRRFHGCPGEIRGLACLLALRPTAGDSGVHSCTSA